MSSSTRSRSSSVHAKSRRIKPEFTERWCSETETLRLEIIEHDTEVKHVSFRKKMILGLFVVVAVLVLAGVFSCSRLPTIVPDLARRSGPAVQLEGERGPLSEARSKAIIDGLEKRGQDTGIFDRHLALEEAIVGSPLTTGNKVVLLQDGPATYQAMLAAILKARDHINMETYILEDDEVGQRFAEALIDKQKQGVQVNLIRDSVGTLGTPAAFFKQLTDSGIEVLEFNPVNPLAGAQGLGSESARPPQAADCRRTHRVPGRDKHQCRLLRWLVQQGPRQGLPA